EEGTRQEGPRQALSRRHRRPVRPERSGRTGASGGMRATFLVCSTTRSVTRSTTGSSERADPVRPAPPSADRFRTASGPPVQSRPMGAQFIFTMHRVGKFVPPDREVLKDISLSFYPGAKIGVIGANGSGKSSLLRIMAG